MPKVRTITLGFALLVAPLALAGRGPAEERPHSEPAADPAPRSSSRGARSGGPRRPTSAPAPRSSSTTSSDASSPTRRPAAPATPPPRSDPSPRWVPSDDASPSRRTAPPPAELPPERPAQPAPAAPDLATAPIERRLPAPLTDPERPRADRLEGWQRVAPTDRFAGDAVIPALRTPTHDAERRVVRTPDTFRVTDSSQPAIFEDTRPTPEHVQPHPDAPHGLPAHVHYLPYYASWYQHPYTRYLYPTTCVTYFGWASDPWSPAWAPPYRSGWVWVPGYWAYGWWHPGYWAPARHVAPIGYVYVPGFWQRDVYVEGYYRVEERDDGDWEWVEGYYLDDGSYVPGHWRPTVDGPEGYVWEPGFWQGETYVDGFWRPAYRDGYRWISAWYDADGVYHAGYWEPVEAHEGYVWIPGWFDGEAWIPGYWVAEDDFDKALGDLAVGEGLGDGEVVENNSPVPAPDMVDKAARPLGIPVRIEGE